MHKGGEPCYDESSEPCFDESQVFNLESGSLKFATANPATARECEEAFGDGAWVAMYSCVVVVATSFVGKAWHPF